MLFITIQFHMKESVSESSLIKLQAPRINFIKERLQHRLFPVKFAKFLRAPCFTEHLQGLLLKAWGFQPATLLKKRLRKRNFSVKFKKFWRTSFDRTPPDDCLLCLYVDFETFFQNISFREHLGETAIFCISCRISTNWYSKELFHRYFFTNSFRRFQVNERFRMATSWYRKVAIRKRSFTWNLWKLSVKKLICQPLFSQNASKLLLSMMRLWKCESSIFSRKCKCEVTCNFPVQLRFIQVNFLHAELWHLTFSWVQLLSNKLEFLVFCNNMKVARTSFCSMFWHVLSYKKVTFLHHGDYNFLFWHLFQIHTFNNNMIDEEMITL